VSLLLLTPPANEREGKGCHKVQQHLSQPPKYKIGKPNELYSKILEGTDP
jgi:hypothetical protein